MPTPTAPSDAPRSSQREVPAPCARKIDPPNPRGFGVDVWDPYWFIDHG